MNSNKRLLIRFVEVFNIVIMTTFFAGCWMLYYAARIKSPYKSVGNWIVILIFLMFYIIFARIYDALCVSMNKISEMIYSQILAVMVSDGFIYIIICLLSCKLMNVLPGICALGGQVFAAIIWSYFARFIYYRLFPAKKTAIVFNENSDFDVLIKEYKLQDKYDVNMILTVNNCMTNISVLDDVEVIFLSDVKSRERNILLKYCVEHNKIALIVPSVGDLIIEGAQKMHMFHMPVLRVERYTPRPEYLIFKRIFDIVIAGFATIILSPVILATAIAIKSYDGGPVFYKQCRLTKDGKLFNVLKFRSMRVDAEANGIARLSSGDNDPRITSVGRVIRKFRIDELPQLFNIIEGSMSIVGPRPERPEIAEQYEKVFPEFRLRLQAKAGLTGYAQVYGQYNTSPYNKLKMDLMYIAKPSFIEDLKICIATVKILFMAESTQGIDVDQETAMKKEM